MTALDRVRATLDQGGYSPRDSGNQLSARCPAHDDRAPSLSVGYDDGKVLVSCKAGCEAEDVVAALSLRMADLFDEDAQRRPECDHGRPWRSCDQEAAYDYVDQTGTVLYTQRRYRCRACGSKTFMPHNPDTRRAGLPRGVRVLYRLPDVLDAAATGGTVYVVEGEKDADRLASLGYVATTGVNGANTRWEQAYTDTLEGAHVAIIADNDGPGMGYAEAAATLLNGSAASVRMLRSPLEHKGADVSDHLDVGLTLADLIPLEPLEPNGMPPDFATGLPPRQSEGSEGDKQEKRGPSQASQLVEIARERYDLFMSEDGRPYGVKLDGPNLALPLRGKAGLRSQLARIYTDDKNGTVPSQSALADAVTVLEGVASAAEPRVPHLRVARDGETIVVDLGTTDGACVIVGPNGWERFSRSPVLFRRSGAMKSLPAPLRDGDGIAKLRGLLNTNEEGFRLLVGWLVAAFIPDLPHPILAFRGEQGTGKSKAAQTVIGIVDPSGAPKRTAPRDIKSWATQAFNSWALCLDNVSIVPDWLSDALCRAVTGDGIVDRALYTDDDVVVLEFRRVLAMTTIDAGALSGDLAERLLTIELNLIPDRERREETELDAAFADAHAAILASLLGLLGEVLRILPDVTLAERPRMADFARVLAAVDQVCGWDTLASYKASARDAVADVLEGEPFAQAVATLADRAGAEGVTVTASELLERVPTPERLPKKWPKDATRAGGQLKRLAPALRTIGIEVDDSKRGPKPKKQRLYTLIASEERRRDHDQSERSEQRPPASPQGGQAHSEQQKQGGRYRGDASVPPTGRGDAETLRGDAGLKLASPASTTAEQGKEARGDAGTLGDAGMQPLSTEVTTAECRNPGCTTRVALDLYPTGHCHTHQAEGAA